MRVVHLKKMLNPMGIPNGFGGAWRQYAGMGSPFSCWKKPTKKQHLSLLQVISMQIPIKMWHCNHLQLYVYIEQNVSETSLSLQAPIIHANKQHQNKVNIFFALAERTWWILTNILNQKCFFLTYVAQIKTEIMENL